MPAPIIGIDLGTTFSLAAWMDDAGVPQIIRDPEKGAMCASVVAFPEAGGEIVGREARDRSLAEPETTVYSVKRLMGKDISELDRETKTLPYKVVPAERKLVRVEVRGRSYTPQEISAMILREIKARADRHFGQAITEAVITVPAYFDDAQRQATRDAGKIAGLKVRRILAEPTAAALAYGLDRGRDGLVAVYDLGGGTFDVSILKLSGGVFQVLSTSGDTYLGGDDFDRAVVAEMRARHQLRFNADLPSHPADLQLYREVAETARIRLSTEEIVPLALPGLDLGTLTRAQLETLTAPLIERTLACCRNALRDAELTPDKVDAVVMVGGVTRMPRVRAAVGEFFKRKPHTELNPDEVVALGAAVQAGMISGKARAAGVAARQIIDVIPLSLGIETMGGGFLKMILRNSPIPAVATDEFSTQVDNQTAVDLHILQGERELAADCRSLGRGKLSGIPPMPAGMPKVSVQFLVDENGLLNVYAREQRSGQEVRFSVVPTHGLTAEEVDRMVQESYEKARDDMDAHQVIDLRNEINTMLRATERMLRLYAGELTADERARIDSASAHCRAVIDSRDKEVLVAARRGLNDATRDLAELGLNKALGESLGRKLADVFDKDREPSAHQQRQQQQQ
jgi:molecular chaperone DnaK (HSP70)